MKIIIVEEDVELGMSLKTELQKQGFTVDLLTDGEESSTRLKMHHSNYDLAILGLNLPGKPGHEICAELRTLQIGLPIMMLVESGMNESKIAAFDVGADDCVAKPISIRE
ncbi:MAG TPA: response regulator transcription factor, partial [Candidatus Paceibacterota bacterium]|nr:response regulator transcription factor [Candidatus Paceibacterota bacterium]